MSDKIIVIISSGEKQKALTGMMYATNAIKNKWMNDVKVIIFGPSQNAVLEDGDLENSLKNLILLEKPIACKRISDDQGTSERFLELGARVEYVGSIISDFIKNGYVPLVF